jgi:HK97 family phage portal protein
MFEKIKSVFTSDKKEMRMPFVTGLSQRINSSLGFKRKGAEFLKEYRGWVFSCVQARSEDVGFIEIGLSKNGEAVESHELLDLLYQVNPSMTKTDLFKGTQAFLDLEGNAFWYLARDNDGKGKIKEIYLLRSDLVEIVISKSNPLLVEGYVLHGQQGQKIPFDKTEILHFRNFNPNAPHPLPHRGMGVVEASLCAIDSDNEAKQWNYSFFKNSATPDGFIVKDGDMSEEEYKRLRVQWNNEHQGTSRAHKIAILSGGLKWQNVSVSPRDMDFLEQRRFGRDEILAMFRVPKNIVGITEDVNRANAEASEYIFARRTIYPLMRQIIETLNEFLVPEFGDDLELTFKSPVVLDRVAVVNEYSAGLDRWLTRNEIRAREGLTPTENGDAFMGTFNLVEIDRAEETSGAKSVTTKIKPRTVDEFIAQLPKVKETRRVTPEAKALYAKAWLDLVGINEKPLVKDMEKFYEKQKDEVIKNIDRELKGLEAKEYSLKAIDDFLFDEEDSIEAGIDLITPHISSYLKQGGEQAMTISGAPDVAFNPDTPSAKKFLQARAKFFAKSITATKRDELFATLNEGVKNNENLTELTARVTEVYSNEKKEWEAQRVARTEISASANEGAVEAYKQAGVEKHEWLVVSPEDVDCLSNEGVVVDVGDDFPSGDKYPPVHPNCECTTVPVFE